MTTQTTDAIRTGDRVTVDLPIFAGGSFFGGRQRGRPQRIGTDRVTGVILRHSYGEKTGQHTFTIRRDDGSLKLVKGRNLYGNIVEHIVDLNSPDRTSKHS